VVLTVFTTRADPYLQV